MESSDVTINVVDMVYAMMTTIVGVTQGIKEWIVPKVGVCLLYLVSGG